MSDWSTRAAALLKAATPGPWSVYRCHNLREWPHIYNEDGSLACGIRSPQHRDPDYGADIVMDTAYDSIEAGAHLAPGEERT